MALEVYAGKTNRSQCTSHTAVKIHQESLYTKLTNFKHVMNVVTKIINSIRSISLKSRFFNALLAGTELLYSDLILHTEVHWLNIRKVVSVFLQIIPQIQQFLHSSNEKYLQQIYPCWLLDFSFPIDQTLKLNVLNL